MPRKQTIFRVIMEKKLGIDWERNEEEDEAEDTSDRQGPMSV